MIGASATGCLLVLLASFGITQAARPQETRPHTSNESPSQGKPGNFSAGAYLQFSEQDPFSALLVWYPPLFMVNGVELKNFIRSRTFAKIREEAGDLRAVDAIYVRAMEMTGHNAGVSLLLATVATFDHYLVGVKVPLLNLFFPLSNESYEDFAARVRNLPAALYADTPPGPHGDRDKLQHFFGSAFVTFAFESADAAARVGEFIEYGEDLAIVDGVLDSRDKRANRHGARFGAALLENNKRYPSEFLRAGAAGLSGATPENDERAGCR